MKNIFGWSPIDGFRLARTVGKYLSNRSNYKTEEFIKAAEIALKKYPKEWVIYFSLGDKYQSIGRYADSLALLIKCVELRHDDVRSTYALATAYNILTRASWSQQEADVANTMFGLTGNQRIDPKLVEIEMKKAGLTIQASVIQAIRWFKKTLDLNPDEKSKNQIQDDLRTLYARFPYIQL